MNKNSDWEAVIGLEIHAELNTKSKLFSSTFSNPAKESNGVDETDKCSSGQSFSGLKSDTLVLLTYSLFSGAPRSGARSLTSVPARKSSSTGW